MTNLRRYIQHIADNEAEAAMLERMALYMVLGYRESDIYRYIQDDGYQLDREEFSDYMQRLYRLYSHVGADALEEEVSSYLLSITYVEDRLNDLLHTVLNNYTRLMSGEMYDEEGNRIPPVGAKEVVNLVNTLQKLKASKVALLRELMKSKAITVNQLPAESAVTVDADFIDVLEDVKN
ncbi:terminase small subunit [Thermus phage phiFa]|nr:terminase small subunit [Thermus phage phiFa]